MLVLKGTPFLVDFTGEAAPCRNRWLDTVLCTQAGPWRESAKKGAALLVDVNLRQQCAYDVVAGSLEALIRQFQSTAVLGAVSSLRRGGCSENASGCRPKFLASRCLNLMRKLVPESVQVVSLASRKAREQSFAEDQLLAAKKAVLRKDQQVWRIFVAYCDPGSDRERNGFAHSYVQIHSCASEVRG